MLVQTLCVCGTAVSDQSMRTWTMLSRTLTTTLSRNDRHPRHYHSDRDDDEAAAAAADAGTDAGVCDGATDDLLVSCTETLQ